MKESPRRYINPFLSDEENEKLNLWNQEFEHSNTDHDKLRISLGQSEICEKEAELYTDKNVMECELPELLICYKDGAFHIKDICVDEGIPNGERVLFDENNGEMLNPQMLKFSTMDDYYMEPNFCSGTEVNFDTDLPVLEPGIDHMSFGDNHDEVNESKSDAIFGTQEADADLHVNGHIKDYSNMGNISIPTETPFQDLQNSISDYKECEYKEEVSDSVGSNELKEFSKDDSNIGNGNSKCAPDGFVFSSESGSVSKAIDINDTDILAQSGEEKINSSDNLSDNALKEQVVSNSLPSLEQNRLLPSLKSLLESIDQQPCQNLADEISKRPDVSGNTIETSNTLNLNNTKPASSSEYVLNIENLEHDELSIEPNSAPKFQDMGSDKVAIVNPIHRGEGESSFSVVGPGSEHITYSGPIAFSGSTSLRSDSSTTSTRSFAFPILPNEWNSSPVRMAKADRRHLQKNRGWRHGLLCCRF
ncbi:hypothetical protein R6Q59_030144 [Mikania micrantha]